MTETPLDRAHAAMTAAPDDDTVRLRFFERLGDAELFLLLESEADGDDVIPRTVEAGGETLVLVFDREERLAEFAGAAPYAALSGRMIAQLLAPEGLGLALNPEVAPSAFVLDGAGVRWLAETMAVTPEEVTDRVSEIHPPGDLPQILLEALDQKLAAAEGLARAAFLVATRGECGATGHMLGFLAPLPGAEPALARAMAESLAFSGLEAGTLDVAFFDADHPMAERLARVGLRFDLPQPRGMEDRPAPGSDPDRPPILR